MTIVIAHRGASGHLPEHTLEAYQLAIVMGADAVEPDLVPTKDGVLVARHENELSGTTDIALNPEFAERRTTKIIDGRLVSGWFTEDLTLAEIDTLCATDRRPGSRCASSSDDSRLRVPTFDDILDLVAREGRRRGRPVGVYPEIKSPSYFRSIGLPQEEALVRSLRRHQLDQHDSGVFIQCFEPGALRRLAGLTRVRLVQLVGPEGAPYDFTSAGDRRTYADLVTPLGLREVSTYAVAIGAHKDLVLERAAIGWRGNPSPVVQDAHDAALRVHVWTLRGGFEEHTAFFAAGVDGVLSDFPDTAVAARELYSSWSEAATLRAGVAVMR